MKSGFSITLAVAVVSAATSAAASVNGGGSYAKVSTDQPALVVVGPVEAYDAKHLTARVLKQTVLLQHATALVVGDSVAVVGTINASGAVVASSIKDDGLYVPGSSAIYLSGNIEKVNTSVGTVVVNGVTVDYTPLLANELSALKVGSRFTVSGIQPTPGGIVVAASVNGGGASAASVNGGGISAASVNGGGAKPASVNGGGISAASVNGGGAKPASVNGGGISAASVNGGGAKAASVNGGGIN